MRTISGSIPNNTSVHKQTYSPSVPLSVYRELAVEVQAVQAKLDTLNAQNQQLIADNQLLRQEMKKAVESVLRLQKFIDSQAKVSFHEASPSSVADQNEAKRPRVNAEFDQDHSHPRNSYQKNTIPFKKPSSKSLQETSQTSKSTPVFFPEMEISSSLPDQVFIEEQEVSYYPYSESEPLQNRRWWLIIAVLLMIVVGFGSGYLIVRPLFEQHNR